MAVTKNAKALTDFVGWISDDRKENYFFIGETMKKYRLALVRGITMLLRDIEMNKSEEEMYREVEKLFVMD